MKWISRIVIVLIAGAAWLGLGLHEFGCAWGTSGVGRVVDCGILSTSNLLFTVILTIVSAALLFQRFRQRPVYIIYGVALSVLLVGYAAEAFLSDYYKAIYVAGMTEQACERGLSLLPWSPINGLIDYRSNVSCDNLHADCSLRKDAGNGRWNEYYCWTRTKGYEFTSYRSCNVITQASSLERCRFVVATKKDDPAYCLSESYLQNTESTLQSATLCIEQFSGKIEGVGGGVEQVIDGCLSQGDLKADVCLAKFAMVYNWPELCEEVSQRVSGFRKFCIESFK